MKVVLITGTTSGLSGLYIFENLDGGIAGDPIAYTIKVIPPAGFTLSSDPNADGSPCIGVSDPVVIASCDNQLDVALRLEEGATVAIIGGGPAGGQTVD